MVIETDHQEIHLENVGTIDFSEFFCLKGTNNESPAWFRFFHLPAKHKNESTGFLQFY
jgi:hypothetical protein